jgi:hypothetical protein
MINSKEFLKNQGSSPYPVIMKNLNNIHCQYMRYSGVKHPYPLKFFCKFVDTFNAHDHFGKISRIKSNGKILLQEK